MITDCLPATSPCTLTASGPCLPLYPRSDTITPLKDLTAFPSTDGATLLWRVEPGYQPPDQKILVMAKNLTTGLMQQQTATMYRGDGVGYIDFVPDAKIGDNYEFYLRAHTDTIGGHWQKLSTYIKDLTGDPQVVQSVILRTNPYQVLVTFDRPITIDSTVLAHTVVTVNGTDRRVIKEEALTSFPHSTVLFTTGLPFYVTDVCTWRYDGGGAILTVSGEELQTGIDFPIINNSQFKGRAFSDGFSLGFS